jgi:2-polyprenyl-6-methoxyphenol hydroxylase-like FAD-dependent oxidoreductase
MATHRALIIGGSISGLFAAHILGRIGWDVDVFERAGEDLAGRGAGIGTHPALHEVMRRLELVLRRHPQRGDLTPMSAGITPIG